MRIVGRYGGAVDLGPRGGCRWTRKSNQPDCGFGGTNSIAPRPHTPSARPRIVTRKAAETVSVLAHDYPGGHSGFSDYFGFLPVAI